MKNSFLDEIDRRIAEVTPEQLAEFLASLKPADPHFKELGVLDLEIQKLWVAIQLFHKEGTDHAKSIFRSEPRTNEEVKDFLQGAKANLALVKKFKAFKAYLSFVVSAQYGWSIEEIEVCADWKIVDRKPACEDCGGQHRFGDLDLDGLGGMGLSFLEVDDLRDLMDEDHGLGRRQRRGRSILDRIFGRP